jgi:threonine synthase
VCLESEVQSARKLKVKKSTQQHDFACDESVAREIDLRPAVQRCIACGSQPADATVDFRCAICGEVLEVFYPALADKPGATRHGLAAELRRTWTQRKLSVQSADLSGVWRFRELLPILKDVHTAVTLQEGNTPLYELDLGAGSLKLRSLLAKHQGMNPTGSFKDIGMTAALSIAKANGFSWAACASTGNTSASMAAYAARAKMNAFALVPEGQIAWSKVAQALDYGAHLFQLKTDFDGCVRVLAEVVRKFPVCLVNSVNPFRREGQKTAAIELMEQLEWRVPEHVIVPGGNLANSSAIGKGFVEMRALGLVDRLPKISIIQAEGANPLARSMRENGGERLTAQHAQTRATAIRIGNPALWKKAVEVLKETGGRCEDVSEDEISVAKAEIGAEGIGCEPASATTFAGLKKLVRAGFVRATDTVVLILTGHTLKDPEYSLEFHREGLRVPHAAAPLRRTPKLLEAESAAVIRELEKVRA